MARQPTRTGTIFRYVRSTPERPCASCGAVRGHFVVRCSAPDGSRPLFHLDPSKDDKDRRAWAKGEATKITEELWRQGLGAAPRAGRVRRKLDAGSAGAWFDTWIADREAKGYTSTRDNVSHYREHIEPMLGEIHIRDWTPDDLRGLCRYLDTKVQAGGMAWKTATNVWGTATKMCDDAQSSKLDALRVRSDNPAADVKGPDRGARKALQYLYPSELLMFVGCQRVPLRWRRAVALAVYQYPRLGELRALRWDDLDLPHGTAHVHRAFDRASGDIKATKTKTPRRFSIEPTLLPLLRAMHAEAGGTGLVIDLPSDRDMARGLRRWLKVAGVKRANLYERSATSKPIRFHDLRASGVTWRAVRGDDPLKIQHDAGHTDFKTTQGYIREADAVRDGFGETFPPLPIALLGQGGSSGSGAGPLSQPLSQGVQVVEILAERTGLEPGKEDAIQYQNGSIRDRGDAAPATDSDGKCPKGRDPVTACDSVTADLAEARRLAVALEALTTEPNAAPIARRLRELLDAASPTAEVTDLDVERAKRRPKG